MLAKTLLEKRPRAIVTATAGTSIDQAMQLLITHNIGCLPVLDAGGKLTGIVSDKDIFRKIYETKGEYHQLTVGDLMTTELIIGLPDDDLEYIAGVMDKNWIRHIPIVDAEKVVGLISQRDIIKYQVKNTEIENRYLNMYMDMLHRRDQSGDA